MNSGNLAICFGCVLIPRCNPSPSPTSTTPLSIFPLSSNLQASLLTRSDLSLFTNQLSYHRANNHHFSPHAHRPTLMGSNAGQNITDAGWQVRVIDTILQNTYQIFDDD